MSPGRQNEKSFSDLANSGLDLTNFPVLVSFTSSTPGGQKFSICAAACPTVPKSAGDIGDFRTGGFCLSDDPASVSAYSQGGDGKEHCPDTLYASIATYGRCVPQLVSVNHVATSVSATLAAREAVYAEINGGSGVSDEVVMALLEEYDSACYLGLIALLFASVWLGMMHRAGAAVKWSNNLLAPGAAISTVVLLWVGRYDDIVARRRADDADLTVLDGARDNSDALLGLSVVASMTLAVYLTVRVLLRRRGSQVVIPLLQEARAAFSAMPMIWAVMLWTIASISAAFALFGEMLTYALSVSQASRGELAATAASPEVTYSSALHSMASAGTIFCLFAFYWTTSALLSFQDSVVAGLVTRWYFAPKAPLPQRESVASDDEEAHGPPQLSARPCDPSLVSVRQEVWRTLTFGNSLRMNAAFFSRCRSLAME